MSLAIGVIRKQVTPVYDYGSGKLSLQQSLGAGGKKGGAYPKRYGRAARALGAAGKGLGVLGGLYTGLETLSGAQQSGRLGQAALSSVGAGTAVGRGISGAVGRQADKLESGFRAKREPEAMQAHYAKMPGYAQEAYQNTLQSFPYQQKLEQGIAKIRSQQQPNEQERIEEFQRKLQQEAWEKSTKLAQGMPVQYPYQRKETAQMESQRQPIIQQQQLAQQLLDAGPKQTEAFLSSINPPAGGWGPRPQSDFYNYIQQGGPDGQPHKLDAAVNFLRQLQQQQQPLLNDDIDAHHGTQHPHPKDVETEQ